tara:strand:+ start:1682 stop:2542 length:861 start_codon:yes stop_codon:yes gene_type:complete
VIKKDFYLNGAHYGTMYHGDCLKLLSDIGVIEKPNPKKAGETKMFPFFERKSVEVTVTSPPYNLCKRYSDYKLSKTSTSMTEKYEKWYDDDLPEWEYQGQQQELMFQLTRVSRSSVFYNHKVRFAWHGRNIYRTPNNLHHPMHWLDKFPIWCEIIWDRCGIGNPSNRYHTQEERIYQIQKPRKWNNKELKLTNIWRFPPSRNEGHVCTFPEKLVENCILPTTDEGDIVLDPYMGSGTTAIVALKHGRRFIGIEKDEEYFNLCCKRIQETINSIEKSLTNINQHDTL